MEHSITIPKRKKRSFIKELRPVKIKPKKQYVKAGHSQEHIQRWVHSCVAIAMEIYPYHEDMSSRKRENVVLRQVVMYIAYHKWRRYTTQDNIAKWVSEFINKEKPLTHCDVIYATKQHKALLKFPKANMEYVVMYETFIDLLKERSLL